MARCKRSQCPAFYACVILHSANCEFHLLMEVAHCLEVTIPMIPNASFEFPGDQCHLTLPQCSLWADYMLRCALPLQSPSSPAPGPSSSGAYAPGPSNTAAYAPGPANSASSNSSGGGGGGGGGFGPDLNSGNYQTVIVNAQYDPGTAALLGNVVGNLSDTIMAGTNLSVCSQAPVMACGPYHDDPILSRSSRLPLYSSSTCVLLPAMHLKSRKHPLKRSGPNKEEWCKGMLQECNVFI